MDKTRYDEEAFAQFLRKNRDRIIWTEYHPRLDADGEDIGGEIEVWIEGVEEGMGHWFVNADFFEESLK